MSVAIQHTTQTDLSSAEICRRNGWGPGTRLEAEPLPKERDRSIKRVTISAVGDVHVLATLSDREWEVILDLHVRDWHEADRPSITEERSQHA